jgi:hypothetical protein
MLQLNDRDVYQTEHQPEDCLLGDRQTSGDNGSLPLGVRVSVEFESNQGVNEQENIVQMAQRSPCPRMNARCYMTFLHSDFT